MSAVQKLPGDDLPASVSQGGPGAIPVPPTSPAVQWRMLTLGAAVWAPYGQGWFAGRIVSLGKNRGDRTVCRIRRETGRVGHECSRYAWQLCWRKPELKGSDHPAPRCDAGIPPRRKRRPQG